MDRMFRWLWILAVMAALPAVAQQQKPGKRADDKSTNKEQIEITAESKGSTLRETICCSAVINWAPTITESRHLCGRAACPPRPSISMSIASVAAMIGPERVANEPTGRPGLLCIPKTWSMAKRSISPSLIIAAAPAPRKKSAT